ncbi:DUF3319 domain-containing protein [Photobacterium toruni]|uniref:DUF3319 domain-containing protein n=1 Tax=Photobacterium toruni TaxID=1935446 RepID=UPI00210FEAB0|nr:DUF3319 domain-containing protein [Photobacterium toruni]
MIIKKRLFHRGYVIENSTGLTSDWKATINGQTVKGMITNIKKSIDWWCDTNAFISPERFNSPQQVMKPSVAVRTEQYRGIILKNDNGKDNQWYAFVRGQLVKGDLISIKKYLDKVIVF